MMSTAVLRATLLCFGWCLLCSQAHCADRPNILWISCEDISPHLGCYGDAAATTPHLDQLASEGVRYSHAYTCHGVCAPSRTGIITGMYPISLGANHMRSKVRLPEHVRCFPEYLRQAGYYCSNNSKTDYNFLWSKQEVWDETSKRAHWKNRPQADQPFFSVFNLTMCHESRIWPANWEKVLEGVPHDERHQPHQVPVPALYPDTPEVRAAIARLYDVIMMMDRRVGELLQELEQAGLSNNTIVVFWSDHGNGLARAKRWVHDSGTRVPMIVRIPPKFRTQQQGRPGSVDDQFINLIDLAPTMLNLAQTDIPDHMQGQPFLGKDLPPQRRYIFGARDRIDERFDLVRSVRDRRFRYVRNLMPWLPALQHLHYAEQSATRQALRAAHAHGQLPPRLTRLLEAPRTIHELYDLRKDPWELNNLADDPRYQVELKRLQTVCDEWQRDVRDAHLLPESLLVEEEQQVDSRWHVFHQSDDPHRWDRLLTAALTGQVREEHRGDPGLRWWQLMHSSDPQVLKPGLSDSSETVRVAAARRLCQRQLAADTTAQAQQVLRELLNSESEFVRHAAVLAVDETPARASLLPQVQAMDQSSKYLKRVAGHIVNGPSWPVPEQVRAP